MITFALGLLVLAVKGIFPFGTETVDYHDLSAQISAFYYHIWDVLHGSKIYFFDWYTALGTNMSVASSGSGFFSFFNLFFLFVKRDCILESMSFFLLMKMAFMSLTMFILVRKLFNTPEYIRIMVSVGYGFCGFVLMNYTIINWLDLAIIAPLIIYYASQLLKDGSMKGFIITMTLGFIHNYYLSFILLLYLFLETGLYLIINIRSKKKTHFPQLGIGVLVSFGISAVITVPQILQTLSSARISNESSSLLNTYLSILSQTGGYSTRWWAVMGLSFCIAGIVIGAICDLKKRNYSNLIWILGSLVLVLSPILFENVNLFWHFGSYVHYPIRYGFLLYITVALALCSYAEKYLNWDSSQILSNNKLLYFLILPALLIFYLGYKWYIGNPGMNISKVIHVTFLSIGIAFIIYLLLIVIRKGRFIRLGIVIWLSELLFYGLLTIGQPTYITGYTEDPEQEKVSVSTCNQLYYDFDFHEEHINRIKNPDESLNANYGFYLRQPVLSNWTHLVSPSLQKNVGRLGYSWQFTRLLDAGGTVFSDALLNINRVVSNQEQNPALYNLKEETTIGSETKYYLYDSNYTLPFALPVDSEYALNGFKDYDNIVDLYNAFYSALLPDSSSHIADYEECQVNSPYEIPVDGFRALYLYGNCLDEEYRNLTIKINGKAVVIPTIQDYDNTLYPAHFNNNVIPLGTFEDETVQTELILEAGDEKSYEIHIFSLDLNAMKELCDSYAEYDYKYETGTHSLNVTVSSDKDRYLLLPVAYNKGWQCKVNGRKTAAINVMDIFTAVPISSGTNEISMVYYPIGLLPAAVISIIFVILAVLAVLGIKENALDTLDRILNRIYAVVWSAVIIAMFIVPIITTLIRTLFRL